MSEPSSSFCTLRATVSQVPDEKTTGDPGRVSDTSTPTNASGALVLDLGTLLNTFFLKHYDFNMVNLITFGLHAIGLLLVMYVTLPHNLLYVLLLCCFLILLTMYAISRTTLRNDTSCVPIRSDKVAAFRRSLYSDMSPETSKSIGARSMPTPHAACHLQR